MPDERLENWLDMTVMGSHYEVQMEQYSGKMRYRKSTKYRFAGIPGESSFTFDEEWTLGDPPAGADYIPF